MALAMPAQAYELKPLVLQLAPSGSGASQSVVITNTHDVPIAVELRTYSRTQKPDGTEDRAPEDEDLIVTPPQAVIPPKASQSFKVRWVGNPAPERELAFRLISEQLPIALANGHQGATSANVTMKYSYEAALYVVPPSSTPLARLSDVAAVTGDDGKTWLQLKIRSEGTRRAILDEASITLTPKAGGQSVTLAGAQLAALSGFNILTGVERVIRLPWPEGLPVGPVQGELKTKYIMFQ